MPFEESMKLKYLKSDSMMELTNAPGSTDEEIEAVGTKVKMKMDKIAKRLDKVARDSKSKKAKVVVEIRPNDQSLFLRAGRLLQQYVVDNYVKIESARLRYIRDNQPEIRAEMYQGLEDALHAGETNAANVGTRTILPSSFIGGRRDLIGRYEDGMGIVLHDAQIKHGIDQPVGKTYLQLMTHNIKNSSNQLNSGVF
ncbi:hypothetical protein RIF29_30060 [Crotalaria pallida]|uniref:Helitron helicase-like domain-containing protein n=1 Tax=Crotalaria pallida TaxID=3830 RepID=A0AAN9EHZ6_CROPI